MSLSVKVLEKQAGTLSRTAIASLGGLITSESTGYTGTTCSTTLVTTAGNHYWLMQGTSGTSFSLNYVTATDCAADKKIYIKGTLRTTTASVEGLYLYVTGSTGGSTLAAARYSPAQYTNYDLSAVVTLDGTFSGKVTLKWMLGNTPDATGSYLVVYNWTAIDLTAQFGAGDEPTAADLDAFFAWRWDGWTYKNYGLYEANGYGDSFYYASKIASHGLEYNDVVYIAESAKPWSLVYPLNDDWIITNTFENDARGDAASDVSYWTKTDYTSRVLFRTFSLNLREDIDASASMTFNCDSTWQPQIGMTVYIFDDTEYLFCGHITSATRRYVKSGFWQSDCVVSSLITDLQAKIWPLVAGSNTREVLTKLIARWVIGAGADYYSYGGLCFWLGNIDEGNTWSALYTNDDVTTAYSFINSMCQVAGLVLGVSGDRKIKAQSQTTTPTAAPRNITDALAPNVQNLQYSEDYNNYGNAVRMTGGYNALGELVSGSFSDSGAITEDTFAGNPTRYITYSDSNIIDENDADTAAEAYYYRFGAVIPGELSFTTTDLDYRPGQKVEVDLDNMGITSTKYMYIDSVTLYDPDGQRLLANVVCSNRDSSNFAAAPNRGSNAFITDLSSKVSQSVPAIKQDAGTFTPAFEGGTTAGTWTWTTQTGYYVRHGNMCFVSIRLRPATIADSPTGYLKLTGLPFTAAATPATQFMPAFCSGLSWETNMTQVQCNIVASSTTGSLYGSYNNGTSAIIPVGNIAASDDVRITGWYQITP